MDETSSSPTEQQSNIENALMIQLRSGANWLYWIAGLSMINSLSAIFGSDIYFVVGLGFNFIVTAVVLAVNGIEISQAEFAVKLVIFILNAIAAGMFVLFGFYANKRYAWAFITGMVLYALDGLIFLALGDYLSIAFHGLALFFIFKGYKASTNLNKLEIEAGITKSGLAQPIK